LSSKPLAVALVLSLGLTATACDKIKRRLGGSKPGGQVVATLHGKEITALELRAEMGGFSSKDPKAVKAAQQQALQQIIMRDILSDKAIEQKLDKAPEFTIQANRNAKTLLAQIYESKLAQGIEPPTKQEAQTYIEKHPDQFAQRRLFVLDQIVAPAAQIPMNQLEALKTLDEVKALLDRLSIPYQENSAAIDTLSANPKSVDEISKMPAGEVFIIPQGGQALIFNRVAQVRSVPFRGELAIQYALEALRKVQLEDLVRTKIVGLRVAAEPQIVYSAGFKPANTPGAPAAPGAPAPK
jgi:peptidyl-prolyl cis-trans isomerase C